jgi:hypothetical protein
MRTGPFLAIESSDRPRKKRLMRLTARTSSLLLLVALAACGGRGGGANGDVDTALLTSDGGDIMLSGGGRLAYEITSDRYRAWEQARRTLRSQGIGLTMRVDPLRVSESDIEKAVTFFERNGKARRAIEGSGLTVRDYVLTTIALEQQMAVASGRWASRDRPRVPARPVAPSESIAAELARDSARRDSMRPGARVDTVPVVDTVVVPVDTVPPPPDTTASPPPRVAP